MLELLILLRIRNRNSIGEIMNKPSPQEVINLIRTAETMMDAELILETYIDQRTEEKGEDSGI